MKKSIETNLQKYQRVIDYIHRNEEKYSRRLVEGTITINQYCVVLPYKFMLEYEVWISKVGEIKDNNVNIEMAMKKLYLANMIIVLCPYVDKHSDRLYYYVNKLLELLGLDKSEIIKVTENFKKNGNFRERNLYDPFIDSVFLATYYGEEVLDIEENELNRIINLDSEKRMYYKRLMIYYFAKKDYEKVRELAEESLKLRTSKFARAYYFPRSNFFLGLLDKDIQKVTDSYTAILDYVRILNKKLHPNGNRGMPAELVSIELWGYRQLAKSVGVEIDVEEDFSNLEIN